MANILELIARGLTCPNCGGVKIRGGYHDWQIMDSFICEKCGLHWQEDFLDFEQTWRFKERGFIWVMCDAEHPLDPLLNASPAEGQETRAKFVSKGIARIRMERE